MSSSLTAESHRSLFAEAGHINSRSVRYLVHNYFAKEHGWLIKGLEPHGHQDNATGFGNEDMVLVQWGSTWYSEDKVWAWPDSGPV